MELHYADDLSFLDESVSKISELLEVLCLQGATIGLKKTRPLRLGTNEDEKVTLGNKKIDQVITYLGSIIN